jgi:signal transduction histidine kinase
MKAAEVLRAEHGHVIKRWLERVRVEITPAKFTDDVTLVDNLPRFLRALENLLHQPSTEQESTELNEACRIHAGQRSHLPQYSLEDVMTEYHVLREVILDVLRATVDLHSIESRIISFSIFHGMREAGSAFTRLLVNKLTNTIDSLEHEKEVREQFVLSLTHDLRQPLQAIRINAGILQRTADHDMHFRSINKIIEHSERADLMLRDLLEVSRVRAGQKIQLDLQECDLTLIAAEVAEELATSHGERFACRCATPIKGWWDKSKLRRAIENLAVNAIKYGWQDSAVTISTNEFPDHVEISVHNMGKPIEADDLAQLFKQFYRSATARRSGTRGWGLGLTLVRGIAEAHGGTVSVASTLDDGTTFTIWLPRDARSANLPTS